MPGGLGNDDGRPIGGVGRGVKLGAEFCRNGGNMPLLLAWLLAWSIERCDMLVAGEEWNEGSASPGVVAVIGEMLLPVVEGIVFTLWKKNGAWFIALAVLLA